MKKQISALIMFFLLGSQTVHAITVSSETEASSDTLSETLSASGPLGRNETPWDWQVDLNHMRTSEAANPKSTVIDEATELNLKAGWQNATGCTADATLIGSMLPQENLKSAGLALGTGYTYFYGAKSHGSEMDASEHDENAPSIGMRLAFSVRNYNQTFESRTIHREGRPDIIRPSSGSQVLNQRSVGLTAKWEPSENWRVYAATEVFSYDRNVGEFASYLESREALRRGYGAVTGTQGGLPNISYVVGAEVDLTERIGLELRETYSVISEDLSTSRQTRIVFATDLGELWRASIGANFTQSLMTGQETAGIIGIEAAF